MKSLKQANIFLIPLLALLIYGCSPKINPAAPQAAVSNTIYAPELTVISLPIDIPNRLIEDSLNAKIKGVILDDQSYDKPEKDDLKLKVTINGRITTSSLNDVFYSSIPLKVWAQARYDACDICPVIEKETSFETIVYFSTKVTVSKDYKLITTTTSNGFKWVVEPKIFVGPVGIPIKGPVEKELVKALKFSAGEIDKSVSTGFDLRSNVQGVWKQLHEPVLVDSTTNTWLKVQPVEFFMSPIKGSPKSLKLNLGLKAYMETYTGRKPEAVLNPVLPELKTGAMPDNSFSINLTSRITFKEATNIANTTMAQQEYKVGKKTVRVDSLRVWGVDNKLAVKASLSKAIKGAVFLTGKPEYSVTDMRLRMREVDFDLNTKNVLHKSAAWMIDGLFSKKLEQQLIFEVGQQIDSVKTQINTTIADYKYQNLFTLKGKVDKLEVRGVYIEPEGIKVAISAKGTANIIVGLSPVKPK